MSSTKLVVLALVASFGTGEGLRAVSASLGRAGCPCIGISGLDGQAFVHLEGNSTTTYPAEVGSRCEAWDDGHESQHCSSTDQSPGTGSGWCAQKWCYVDPCNCDSKVLDAPPAQSMMLQASMYKATPLYYSYATCGSTDSWTATENKMACSASKDKEACEAQDCSWKKTEQWGEVCLGLEAAGLCGVASKAPEWGKEECPCVGFAGLNGTLKANIGNNRTVAFPAETGASCAAWDMDRNPDCIGEKKAEGCDQKWCFVDTKTCKGNNNLVSTFAPHAKVKGSPLHYSYDTCGSVAPKEPPQGTAPGAIKFVKHQEEEEEIWHSHDIKQPLAHDNMLKKANAAKAAAAAKAAMAKKVPTANEIAREEHAKRHPQVEYNHDAYDKEWHGEWEHGHVPSFRSMHPEVPASAYDRQSDGKASPVKEQ